MAALVGLFDPTTSDEPAGMEDLDELLSATALLESKPIQRSMMPPRSKTTLDLSAQFRASSAEMANKAIGKYELKMYYFLDRISTSKYELSRKALVVMTQFKQKKVVSLTQKMVSIFGFLGFQLNYILILACHIFLLNLKATKKQGGR